jgi:Domain of unknown function (DUF4386)
VDVVRRAGRVIGLLILVQMVGGSLLNFVLEAPLFRPPGFLANAASHSQEIALGAVLGVVLEALWIGIAAVAFPIFYERSQRAALCFFAVAAAILALAVVENAAVMSMVSVSEAYAKASAGDRSQLETVRVIVASARNWVHYMARMTDGLAIVVFYVAVYRLAVIPRLLAGFGVVAAALQIIAVGMPLFHRDVVFVLLAPLGLCQLIVAIWLVARGFQGPPHAAIEVTRP